MSLYWTVVFFAVLRDLVRIADAVADWSRPGRHRTVVAHASWVLRGH